LQLEEETTKGQRVIIYPKEMTKLTEVLITKNPNVDPEDGHQLAYSIILQTAQTYEHPPLFMSEDNEQITSNEEMKENVAEWMNTAAKVATGNRRRVLEDGRDVMNSDEEDAIKEVEPDEEQGIYAPGCSSLDQARMTQEQAMAQREAALAKKIPRAKTPADSTSDDDDPNGQDLIWSHKGFWRPNENKKKPDFSLDGDEGKPVTQSRAVTEPPPPLPEKGSDKNESERQPTPASSDTEDQEEMTEDQKCCARIGKKKAAASQRAAAVQKPIPEAKASKPVKGQESPETKVSKPMETRRQAASRAGGLRSGGSSGQTGTRVASCNPPKT
jgi:hypothetical protein